MESSTYPVKITLSSRLFSITKSFNFFPSSFIDPASNSLYGLFRSLYTELKALISPSAFFLYLIYMDHLC